MGTKKLLYLHGFASSGASGTVEVLRRAFWQVPESERMTVIAPDIPVDPKEALTMLREMVKKENPDIIVGSSMGGMYAQQLRGVPRICVNPSFSMSKLYSLLHVGKYQWLNKRCDGKTEFHIYKETIRNFEEVEAHQFDDLTDDDRILCYGLFGDADDLTVESRAIFAQHYPSQFKFFSGGHRLNDDIVHQALIPAIRELV